MGGKYYITTTLPYVNAEPHIGFAWELVQADVMARYRASLGEEVFFNTGTDEHGLKIYRKALEEGKEPQAYADEYAAKFKDLKQLLNLSNDLHFIRTTDANHKKAAQEFWKRCRDNGDIYKGAYKIKYCVGCELEKTDSELADGRCPIHPNLELELIEEENYFFRFSKYAEPLAKMYRERPDFVLPAHRLSEIKKFVEAGLNDFSISRLKEKMPWGVPVPDDEKHVMYVWFDALVNYISTLGWPDDEENFRNFWGTKEHPNGIQLGGKDQVRQQAAMWQAMLLSAGLPTSKQIVIHGFITSGGEKMSKSLGNVIDPREIVREYGADALRYWLLRELNTFEDGDFTMEKFNERYNADLANGLGNLVSRTIKMALQYFDGKVVDTKAPYRRLFKVDGKESRLPDVRLIKVDLELTLEHDMETFQFTRVLGKLWSVVHALDFYIEEEKPFKLIETDRQTAEGVIWNVLWGLNYLTGPLKCFLPKTADEIKNLLSSGVDSNSKSFFTVKPVNSPLFPRIG